MYDNASPSNLLFFSNIMLLEKRYCSLPSFTGLPTFGCKTGKGNNLQGS